MRIMNAINPDYKCFFETKILDNGSIINSNMLELHKKTSGFIGRCLVSPDRKRFWVNIPKNASNTISNVLLNSGWKGDNYIESLDLALLSTPIVFLRNPFDRWYGSVAELCLHKYQSPDVNKDLNIFLEWFENSAIDMFIKNPFIYDIHFIRQLDYCMGLNINETIFIHLDTPNINETIKKIFDYDREVENLNMSVDDAFKSLVRYNLKNAMNGNIWTTQYVEDFYSQDYYLLEEIRKNGGFYE